VLASEPGLGGAVGFERRVVELGVPESGVSVASAGPGSGSTTVVLVVPGVVVVRGCTNVLVGRVLEVVVRGGEDEDEDFFTQVPDTQAELGSQHTEPHWEYPGSQGFRH